MTFKPLLLGLLVLFAGPTAQAEALPQLARFQEAAAKAGVVLALPDWERTPEQISQAADQAMREGDQALDRIAALPPSAQRFANTFAALDLAFYPALNAMERIELIRETQTDAAMRDAAFAAGKKLQDWMVSASFREDVYRVIQQFADTHPAVSGEDALLLRDTLRDYRRNGMALPPEPRRELETLKKKLEQLGLEFARNLSEDASSIEFSAADLAGVSQDFLDNKTLKTEQGSYRINANVSWQVIEVSESASSENTRRRLAEVRGNRAREQNTPIFIEMLKIRARIAAILGFATWADYQTEPKMAKTGATALAFATELRDRLAPKFAAELEVLRALKVEQSGDAAARIENWDVAYFENQLKKTRYQIDTEALKNYFELGRTLDGMFRTFEELFALRIEEIDPGYKWIADLKLYAVSDANSGAPLGLIYMDLFPREAKYNHFAQFGITNGHLGSDGRYQRPVVALVCNFPPPTATKPSLLSHDQVETIFHEFGHALHSVLTQAKYATFSGTSVPRDFVEAPSQMLENWVRDKRVLDRFAADYRDPSQKIPAETLDRMEEARVATTATHYRRQLGFALLDLTIHGTRDTAVFEQVVKVTNDSIAATYLPVPQGTAMIASFGHLAGGYDAGYYGYAWSDAISADLASAFRSAPGGFMDKEVGQRLRREIYAPGGSREAEDSIRAYLGRERSMDAFLQFVGLKAATGG
jgi:thimet oligopeptidase